MFWHYLGTALHNLRRHPVATAMHIVGLAFGLACFVLTFTFIESLRVGEPNLPNADHTYLLTQDLLIHNAAKVIPASPRVTLAAYDYLKADFPQLESIARVVPAGLFGGGRISIISGEKGGFVTDVFVDPAFLKILHPKFLAGDPSDPFKQGTSGSIITERAALRIFGTRDVVGRRFMFRSKIQAVITAVIADVPQPSHIGDSDRAILRFDMLSPYDPRIFAQPAADWTTNSASIYLVLPPNGSLSAAALRASLRTFGARHMPASVGRSNFDIVPVSQVRQLVMNQQVADTGVSIVTSLYTLASLVLIVACFNYANLATALALRRTREVALRKIVGAKRRQLVLQCLVEAGLVGSVALLIAVAATVTLLPVVNIVLTQTALSSAAFLHVRMWLFLVALVFTVVLLGGVYPAWTLSRLQPVEALRATSSRAGAGRYIPQLLIGLQFIAAGFLVVMLLVVQGQNRLMREALVGIARNPTLVVTTSIYETPVDMQTLRGRLLESPAVESVSAADNIPWGGCCWVFVVSHSQDPAVTAVQSAGNRVGVDYFKTVGLKLLAGRTFQPHSEDEMTYDDYGGKRTLNVIIDQDLARQLGYASPTAAIGTIIYRQPYLPRLTLRIVGVVESAASRLTDDVGSKSDLYLFGPVMAEYTIIRFHPEQVAAAVAHLQKTWKALAPGVPLERSFIDQRFEAAYGNFGIISSVATALTACAFVIALMGLFGMAVQVTNGRLREIGVRKTLGAKSRRIFMLLLLDFARPVVVANLIAWPFAALAAHAYLNLFYTPMHLTWMVYIASLASTVVIACVVVCGQSWRAARAHPADVLRYE